MLELKGKKILVTGADGFIGSHLTESLVKQGHKVRAFVYYNSFNSWGWLDTLDKKILESVEICAGDIRDSGVVQKVIEDVDVVFHLAALIAIPYSYRAPESYVQTNILGTLNLLQACQRKGIERFVHTSTSEVYGTARFVPITEEHPLCGQSPYSASKIGADEMALSYFRSFKLPVSVIRPFNTYGPRQSARAVIPTIITQVQSGAEELKLGFLDSTRDFTFVDDTVRGFLAVGQADKALGEVINIGSNFEISVGDLAESICEVLGRKVPIKVDSERLRPKDSEVERLWASNKKAHDFVGWQPEYGGKSGLKKGLQVTAQWFQENKSRYKTDIYNV
jgi:NAD dependent epimerase/dehydratase